MFSKAIFAAKEHLAARPDIKRIAINSSWLIGDKVLRLFMGLLVGAWVARYLGPLNYGRLAYIVAFLAIFQSFAVLGLDGIIVRDLAKKTIVPSKILGSALVLRLIAATLALATACVSIHFLYPTDTEYLWLVLLIGIGIIFQTADIVDLWFQSQSQSRRTVGAKAVAYVLAAMVKIFLIVSLSPLWMFAAVQGGEVAISALALYFSYKRFPVDGPWHPSIKVAKKLLRESWPFLISALLIIVYMRSSQFFIERFAGSASVGVYSAAQVLSELWYFLPMTICASVAPIVARKKALDQKHYEDALKKVFCLMWVLSIGIAIFVATFANPIVGLLYGPAYRESGSVLAIHIFTLIPVCLGVSQSIWLINENRSSLAVSQAVVGAISSVSLNYLLIQKYGITGAAMATVISQCIQAFAVNIVFAPQLLRIQMDALFMPFSLIRSLLVKGKY